MRITRAQYDGIIARAAARAKGKPAPVVPEKEIQSECEDFLKSLGHRCFYIRSLMFRPSTFTRNGTPDFVGWLDGRPFAIEVKRRGKKETREQAGELLRANLAGAVVGVAHSLAEFKAIIGATE